MAIVITLIAFILAMSESKKLNSFFLMSLAKHTLPI
jgi:hypothetical protein